MTCNIRDISFNMHSQELMIGSALLAPVVVAQLQAIPLYGLIGWVTWPRAHKSSVNLVPRVFSLSNMAAAGEKTLAHSRNHVTDLSTESGNLFKMAAKVKSERIWVRGLETGEKQTE